MYNKHSIGNWGPFVSIADRVEALFEHAKRVSLPEPCLTGGGTKGPKLPNECLLYMEEPFLLYWICHIKNAVLKYNLPPA